MCEWNVDDVILMCIYFVLLLWCLLQFSDHYRSWSLGQANGLVWYLICTSLLCMIRCCGFMLPTLMGPPTCYDRYKPWQWEIENRQYGGFHSFMLVLVSTVPSGLFFTSYVYFAMSLTRVIDMLTNNEETFNEVALFTVLILSVWISISLLLISALCELKIEPVIDRFAQVVVGLTALLTCLIFSFHSLKALLFLRSVGNDNGIGDKTNASRAMQLAKLLKLNRVFGVSLVCTVCFCTRALLLLLHTASSALLDELYFLGAEIVPTIFMLYIFRGGNNSDEISSAVDMEDPNSEYELLKASIRQSLDLSPNLEALGLTFNSYQSGGAVGLFDGKRNSAVATAIGIGKVFSSNTSRKSRIRGASDFMDRYKNASSTVGKSHNYCSEDEFGPAGDEEDEEDYDLIDEEKRLFRAL